MRNFLPIDFKVETFEGLEQWLQNLMDRDIDSLETLEKWLKDNSELESIIAEDMAWRYIKMTIDTRDESNLKAYQYFVQEISPRLAPYSDSLNKKLTGSKFLDQLKGEAYFIYLRKVKKDIEMFRKENIALSTKIASKSQKYGEINGQMSIELDGNKLTLPKAAAELQKTDRDHRENVWRLISDKRLAHKDELELLYTDLVQLRDQVAQNAKYSNFRDYMFDSLGRFDYNVQDCFNFHESISSEIVPLAKEVALNRKSEMGLKNLRPWDLQVDTTGRKPLKPFQNAEELIDNSIIVFNKVDPYFGDCLKEMKEGGYLDLASKEGKAPGGYNYPLYESGIPFIFMNSVGSPRDLVTMMHEGGHAVHSFLSRDLELSAFKSFPSEVAELASMSMELISMDHWDVFYKNEEDLKRAKKEHLEDIISTLPWIAVIDKFQHWIYENPNHSNEDRIKSWRSINDQFGNGVTDWSGLEENLDYSWHRQLHLFEVPFYYIEYGMSQLGALAIWRNYKENPKKAISQYKEALQLGYTKSIKEIYKTAGIEFNFSKEYIRDLSIFLQSELSKI